jgi:P27 family predicted phage terminase small subunit
MTTPRRPNVTKSPRISVEEKKRRGTYHAGRDNRDAIAQAPLAIRLPSVPPHLDPEAKVLYRRMGKELVAARMLTVVDGDVLATWAEAVVTARVLNAKAREAGYSTTDKNGEERVHPLVRAAQSYRTVADRAAVQLGLTPGSRQRILAGLPPLETADDEGPIGRLLRERSQGREWWEIDHTAPKAEAPTPAPVPPPPAEEEEEEESPMARLLRRRPPPVVPPSAGGQSFITPPSVNATNYRSADALGVEMRPTTTGKASVSASQVLGEVARELRTLGQPLGGRW